MVSQVLQAQVIELSQRDVVRVPHTIKNKVLLAPGEWNGFHYSAEEIEQAFHNTDWNNKDVKSIIADHADKSSIGVSVHDWFGWIENAKLEDGSVVADLKLFDEGIIGKLVDAKAKFGISAKVAGIANEESRTFTDFTFENFSIVSNPACKMAFINLSQKNNDNNLKGGINMTEGRI